MGRTLSLPVPLLHSPDVGAAHIQDHRVTLPSLTSTACAQAWLVWCPELPQASPESVSPVHLTHSGCVQGEFLEGHIGGVFFFDLI